MQRSQKLVRGWSVAFVSTSAPVLSHTFAGGNFPPLILWALCTALSALFCVGLAGIKMPRAALAVSIALSQGIFHTLYSHAGSVVLQNAGHELHHAGHLAIAGGAHQHSDSPLMSFAHSIAALATYAMVRQADRLIAGITHLAQNPWRRVTGLKALPSLPRPMKVLAGYLDAPLVSRLLVSTWTTRGPPAVQV